MSSAVDAVIAAVVAGEDVDLRELPTGVLQSLFAAGETVKQRIDVLQVEAGAEIVERGHQPRVVTAALRQAKVADWKRRIAVIEALPSLPASRAAFGEGKLRVEHLAALARTHKLVPEPFAAEEADLVGLAATRSVRGFTQALTAFVLLHKPAEPVVDPGLGVDFVDRGDGTGDMVVHADGVTLAILRKTLGDLVDSMWRGQHPERNPQRVEVEPYRLRLLRALMLLCEQPNRASRRRSRRHKYLLQVLIDYQTLLDGLHARSVCTTADGRPLSVEAVRKLACEADVLPIVLNGDSVPIDLGRTQRWFTPDQHTAALAMHQTCVLCDAPAEDCALHHDHDWHTGGPTDIANAVPACPCCHDLIHRLGLRAERANGVITLYHPDGRVYATRSYGKPTIFPSRELQLIG